jgi:hypothetical protein
MAVTRINNNQITAAIDGNAVVGVNAASRLQNYTVTSTKLANNLTYGSNLTITGNLTVQGTTTTIDTVNTLIEDPILVLADGQTTGTPSVDIGILGYRGNQNSSFLGWIESTDTFAAILSNTTVSNTTVNVSSYADFTASTITAQANLSVIGNIVGNANFSGNISTPGFVSAAGNVTGGNLRTGGLISATGNVTGGNMLTAGLISATSTITSAANITGGNVLTGGLISATANITGGNVLTGGLISATANITGGNLLTGGLISATSTITSAANITGGNILTGGLVSATGNIDGGNLRTGGLVTATGNVTGGNILTGGLISATGNITGGNIISGNAVIGNINVSGNITVNSVTSNTFVSATGNVIGGNLNISGNIVDSGALTIITGSGDLNLSPAGNIVLGNRYVNGVRYPIQDQDAASKIYVDNLVSTAISYHEAVVAATTANLATTTGGTITYAQPNGAANGIGATLTTTGSFNLIDTANVQSANTRILVKDEANAAHNGVYVWSNATVITRAATENTAGLGNVDALGLNDYFYTTSGNVNKGTAFIVDAPSGLITFGTSNIQFAVFSQSQVYSANTSAGLNLAGTIFSAKVDNITTAFDIGGNISVKASANLTTPNIGAATGTSLSVTGAVNAGTTISAAGNITGGNVLTGGLISATGAVTSGGFTTTGNVTGGNILSSGSGSFTGNVTAANFFGNISGNIDAAGANTQVQFNDTGDILGASAGFTFNKVGNILTANGNINGANLFTGGSVSATANITGGNVLTGGLISATGTITSAANVIGGNISTAGLVTATGNVTGGNINTAGLITATGNITGANLILTSGIVDGPAAGRITINGSDIDTDFAVDGDTLANVFYVDAGTGTASFGSSTQVTNAIVNFAVTSSIKAPVGNTAQRPATGVTGMMRFNTTSNALEVYDNSAWTSVGVPVFTVIDDQQFAGDGTTVAFTLGSSQTTNSCIVSINGVVQIPSLAYSVSTTTLTFTEAPAVGDVIDVRQITTTTTVTSIANSSGNAVVAVSPTANDVLITGDLVPTGNATANLGSATNYWNSLYVGGNTIFLGGLQLKEVSANTFGVFTSDGVTQANVDVGNIDVSSIVSGTSTIGIASPNGNAFITVGGTANVFRATTTGVLVNGVISASGNIDGGNLRTAGLISATGSVTAAGNIDGANLRTAGLISATGNITGGNILGGANVNATTHTGTTVNVTGNIDGGNLRTGGLISATGTITGAAITGTSISVSTGNITGGNLLISGAIEDSAQLDIRTTASNANIVLTPNGTGNVNIGSNVMPTANATANIGSATLSFNTIFARATSAQYADLAEKYTADADYEPGTVVQFGGSEEVTVCAADACKRVAGVISTNPSYIMNGGLEAAHVATVALTGRVPCKVTGTVRKGDLMVSAGNGCARAEENPQVGTVIGKALADSEGNATIEVVVGRF